MGIIECTASMAASTSARRALISLKFTGMNYDHPSAADSWRRILSFSGARLRDGSPATKETGAPTS
jgi:hypothetical protein